MSEKATQDLAREVTIMWEVLRAGLNQLAREFGPVATKRMNEEMMRALVSAKNLPPMGESTQSEESLRNKSPANPHET